MRRKPPTYRTKTRGRQRFAVVTLTDSTTKHRRDYYLGEADTIASREAYHRLIAEWEAAGRRLPRSTTAAVVFVADIVAAYWRHAGEYYSPKEADNIRLALRQVKALYASTPAADFGPRSLATVRDAMVQAGWSRPYINKQIHRIAAMFRWAAAGELIPATIYTALKTITPLRRGKTIAREPEKVQPVKLAHVRAIARYVSRPVWRLIVIQYRTAARGAELFTLRPMDIDQAGNVWSITHTLHKTAHMGKTRTLRIGPKAQATISKCLIGKAPDACLFSPHDAERERLAKMQTGKPGKNTPPRLDHIGEHYSADSYRVAIRRACIRAADDAFYIPRADGVSRRAWFAGLNAQQREELKAHRAARTWHPHQLRHAAATAIRAKFGLEAAQLFLGHSSAIVTDAVYAERNTDVTDRVALMIG